MRAGFARRSKLRLAVSACTEIKGTDVCLSAWSHRRWAGSAIPFWNWDGHARSLSGMPAGESGTSLGSGHIGGRLGHIPWVPDRETVMEPAEASSAVSKEKSSNGRGLLRQVTLPPPCTYSPSTSHHNRPTEYRHVVIVILSTNDDATHYKQRLSGN